MILNEVLLQIMNIKKCILFIYGIVISLWGIISIVTTYLTHYNIQISNWFYISTIFIPSIVGILFLGYYLKYLFNQKSKFIQDYRHTISDILEDDITIDRRKVNIDTETDMLFKGIFHHDCSNGVIFTGRSYRYFNINLFNYSNIDDLHSAHTDLFNGLMLQVNIPNNKFCDIYIIKKNFFDFDACNYFKKNMYNIKHIDDCILCYKCDISNEYDYSKNLYDLIDCLSHCLWAIYIHNNCVSIVIKSYKIYDLNDEIFIRKQLDLAESILCRDTCFIKHILDTLNQIL